MWTRLAWLILGVAISTGCAAERLAVWSCPPIEGSTPQSRSVTAFHAPPGSAPRGALIRAFSLGGEAVGMDSVHEDGSILMGLRSSESLDDTDIELRLSDAGGTVQKIIHIARGAPTDFHWEDDEYRAPRRHVTDRLEPRPVDSGGDTRLYDTPVERAMILNMVSGHSERPSSLPSFGESWEHSILAARGDWWLTLLGHLGGETSGCWELGPPGECTRVQWAEGLCSLPTREPEALDAGSEPDAGPADAGPQDAGPPPD